MQCRVGQWVGTNVLEERAVSMFAVVTVTELILYGRYVPDYLLLTYPFLLHLEILIVQRRNTGLMFLVS
jgi:hypothetical protein